MKPQYTVGPLAAAALAVPGSMIMGHTQPSTPVAGITSRPQISPAASTTADAHLLARSITVKPGDTLAGIARTQLGSSGQWRRIWWDNRDKVANPDIIIAGQHLNLPRHRRTIKPWLRRRSDAAAVMPRPAPVHPAAAPAPASSGGGSMQSVSAAPGSFEQCVIQAESGGNPRAINPSSGASGLVGFLPSTWASTPWGAAYPGGAYTAPPNVQLQAFQWLYSRDGTAPWAPYDGC